MSKEIKEEVYDLLLNQGVYGKISSVDFKTFDSVFNGGNTISSLDLYCPTCKADKTFVFNNIHSTDVLGTSQITVQGGRVFRANIRGLTYMCPTCKNRIYFLVYHDGENIIKLAQYPSLYDVSRDELKKYQKNNLIDNESFSQIYKAELCASSGYYVAAYTYMRRVYETMLLSVFDRNKEEIGLTEDDFRKLHSDKKLETIKDYLAIDDEIYLPLYGLLSAGIHAMTEEQCCEDYNVLKSILLDILAEQKAKKEKESKRKELKELFAKRKGEMK